MRAAALRGERRLQRVNARLDEHAHLAGAFSIVGFLLYATD
jgi:hypothetical protein